MSDNTGPMSAHDVHAQGLDAEYECQANYQNDDSTVVKCYPIEENDNPNYETEKITVEEWYERRENNQKDDDE